MKKSWKRPRTLYQRIRAFKAFSRVRRARATRLACVLGGALGRASLDWVTPPFCRECGSSLREASPLGLFNSCFCVDCRAGVEWLEGACPRCAAPGGQARSVVVPRSATAGAAAEPPRCDACVDRDYAFDSVAAAARYSGPARTAILRFKFHGDRGLLSLLVAVLGQTGRALQARAVGLDSREVAVVPVPQHPWKRLLRGADPVDELARRFARELALPFVPALRKVRHTRTQVQLPRSARERNLRRAFVTRQRVVLPRTIILVDDVLTTGTTASQCAVVLKKAGAAAVHVVVVARS